MVKKRKNALRSSVQVVDSPMKEPRIISNVFLLFNKKIELLFYFYFSGGNQLEKARNSLNDALDIIAKKEQKKTEIASENFAST